MRLSRSRRYEEIGKKYRVEKTSGNNPLHLEQTTILFTPAILLSDEPNEEKRI